MSICQFGRTTRGILLRAWEIESVSVLKYVKRFARNKSNRRIDEQS